jgi:hypothetical protein
MQGALLNLAAQSETNYLWTYYNEWWICEPISLAENTRQDFAM